MSQCVLFPVEGAARYGWKCNVVTVLVRTIDKEFVYVSVDYC